MGRRVSSVNVLGKLDIYTQKNELGSLYYTTQKINSKWIKDLSTVRLA